MRKTKEMKKRMARLAAEKCRAELDIEGEEDEEDSESKTGSEEDSESDEDKTGSTASTTGSSRKRSKLKRNETEIAMLKNMTEAERKEYFDGIKNLRNETF